MRTHSRASSVNPYENPDLWRWAGGMEGVPEWIDPGETVEEREGRVAWQEQGHERFSLLGALLPGITIAVALAWFGRLVSQGIGSGLLGLEKSPISPILVAILVGLLIRNTIGLPSVYEAGLRFGLQRVLRIGVALLGIRLSLLTVGVIGLAALPVVIACIATALLLVSGITRVLGLPRRLGTLIAVGTAICGNTAIVATAPVIGADEDETSYAVGTITVFGLLALVVYPFLAHSLFDGDAALAGTFLGTAIHDTAQVAGAGLLYMQQYASPEALDTATVTKLMRNLFMIAVIPLMAFMYHAEAADERPTGERPSIRSMIPGFVFGFIAMAFLRTIGDLGDAPFAGLITAETWSGVIRFVSTLSAWSLTIAMAAVGLGTNLKRLRSLGLRPLAAGLVAALSVGVVSAVLVRIVVPFMHEVLS
ncbi:MAG: putative sulfate exporter family transporter [Deltaproteobacteria bacterium]|nr:putative sulfate exporter family transporter [Deltaproteobacteria bacterium]MBW2395728.1 putative sulfate exporter family transporter [Deltaproteobacteria bacterium]